MESLFLPPTLMPRRRTTYLGTAGQALRGAARFGERLQVSWLQHHALAAAAFAGLVGILEGEAGLEHVLFEVHHRAQEEQRCLGLDVDVDAPVVDVIVARNRRREVVERIGLP